MLEDPKKNQLKIDFSLFFLLLFSVYVCIESYQLGVGSLSAPELGLFPFLTGALLAGLSAARLLQLIFWPNIEARLRLFFRLRRVGLLVAILALYVLLLHYLGFFFATLLFGTAQLKFLESKSIWFSLLVGTGFAVFSHVVFRTLLNIQLPRGVLGF